jgi:hypothetical protein
MRLIKNKWYKLLGYESVVYLGADWASDARDKWRVYRFLSAYGEMRLTRDEIESDLTPYTKLDGYLRNV